MSTSPEGARRGGWSVWLLILGSVCTIYEVIVRELIFGPSIAVRVPFIAFFMAMMGIAPAIAARNALKR